ncbi:LAMI_0E13498g1_1 [Lachancea mirantina]|uniref:LAMI_0E13498g1_1 n=1 Tax=Lachancea mirantina TaxID=1230905 RepID=A0A1G4JRB3_9SACH|nr:LAMI_0E13498g1_1 [Lachancea mirantina]
MSGSTETSVPEDLIKAFDIRCNKGFFVGKSDICKKVKGVGGFIRKKELEAIRVEGNSDVIELLRIPRLSTFSIYTLLEIVNDENNYADASSFSKTSAAVKASLEKYFRNPILVSHISESLLLVSYFTLFECLRYHGLEIPEKIKKYLDLVLLDTEVDSVYSNLSNSFETSEIRLFRQYGYEKCSEIFNALIDVSNVITSDNQISVKIAKICASCMSRSLEIPEAVDVDSDDFRVNNTLVPVLDFVNHDNDQVNAHFDVDRETGDVLLLLDETPQEEEEFEVFISYSPYEELFNFERTYGFAPVRSKKSPQFWNMCFEKNFFKKFKPRCLDLACFYKWFSIRPCVQLILLGDQVYINDTIEEFRQFLLPFFDNPVREDEPRFEYNPNCYLTFARFAARANGGSENDYLSYYEEVVRTQERSRDETIGIPQLAWSCRFWEDSLVSARFDKEQCMSFEHDSEEDYEKAKNAFEAYFCEYCAWRMRALSIEMTQPTSNFWGRLAAHEQTILGQILLQKRNKSAFFWSEAPSSLTVPFTGCPVLPNQCVAFEIDTDMTKNDHFSYYEESRYSDYVDEEYEHYHQFFNPS